MPQDESTGVSPRNLTGIHAVMARIISPVAARPADERVNGDAAVLCALGSELADTIASRVCPPSIASLNLAPRPLIAVDAAVDPLRSAPRTIAGGASESRPLLSLAAVVPIATLPR